METYVTTVVTLGPRFFGSATEEMIDLFSDGVDLISGVCETAVRDGELFITFEDTLPGDAKKALRSFIKRYKL